MYDSYELEHKGHTFQVNVHADSDYGTPWDNSDCHGPVSKWTTRDKAPGERVLCSDRGIRRYYDFAEAIKIARRDKWGAPAKAFGAGENPTAGQIANAAVEADFEYLRSWCADEWCFVWMEVKHGEYSASLAGVESLHCYYKEVARELADEVLADIKRDTELARELAALEAALLNHGAYC